MKRTLAIILVVVLVASCAFAATSTKFTKYGNIFKSHEYTLKGTSYEMGSNGSKTGTGSPKDCNDNRTVLHQIRYFCSSDQY